jgi:hypothetical protein
MKVCASVRAVAAACAVALALLRAPAAYAQSAPAAVVVDVVDGDGQPLAGALLYAVEGAKRTLLGRTDARGRATPAPAPGTALVAEKDDRVSEPVIVRGVRLRIVVGLAQIGAVRARREPFERTYDARSAASLVTGDVASAMEYVPNYRSADEGGSGAVTVNGSPLMLPPGLGGGNRLSLPSSLVSSVNTAQADDGTIQPNFRLLAPTADRRMTFSAGIGSRDGTSWKSTFSGRAGKLGAAAVLAGGGDGGVLDGRAFADSSGLTYDHGTHAHHVEGSLDLEYQLGSTQLSLVGLGSRTTGADVVATLPGTLPQGIGPGNLARTAFGDGYVMASQVRGRDYFQFIDVRVAGSSIADDAEAVVANAAIPSYSGYRYSARYDELTTTRNYDGAALTLKLSDQHSSAAGFSGAFESPSDSDTLAAGVAYTRSRGAHTLSLALNGLRRAGGFAGGEINGTLSGGYAGPRSSYGWSAYVAQAQTLETYAAAAYRLSPPTAVAFNCAEGQAFATGPSDTSGAAPRSATLKANAALKIGARTDLTAGGFYAVTTHALAPALESNAVALPAGYLDLVERSHAQLCGGAPGLSAADLFLTRYHTVGRRVGAEWYLSQTTRSGAFALTTSFERYALVAHGVPVPSPGVVTTLVEGAQALGVPLERASAILSVNRRGLAAALGLQYVSGNNAAHLPAHLTASVGAQAPLGRGTLTLSGRNALHGYAGAFASPRYAEGFATTLGPVFPLATPIQPTWTLRYEFATHAPR